MPEERQAEAKKAILAAVGRAEAWHLLSWCEDDLRGYAALPVTSAKPVKGCFGWTSLYPSIEPFISREAIGHYVLEDAAFVADVDMDSLEDNPADMAKLVARTQEIAVEAASAFLEGETHPCIVSGRRIEWGVSANAWVGRIFTDTHSMPTHMLSGTTTMKWTLERDSPAEVTPAQNALIGMLRDFVGDTPVRSAEDPDRLALVTRVQGLGMDGQFVLNKETQNSETLQELLAIEDDTALMREIHDRKLNRHLPLPPP